MAALALKLKRCWGAISQGGLSLVLLALRKVADICYGLSGAYSFAVTEHEWPNAALSLRSILDPPNAGPRVPRAYYRRARAVQQARIKSPTLHITKVIFRAVAPPDKIIWVRPDEITYKVLNDLSLYCNDILPGDWDRRAKVLEIQLKHRAVIQRFQDGMEWQDTDLFRDIYDRRFKRGDTVRGTRNLSELTRDYQRHFDDLYADLKEQGFRAAVDEEGRTNIPHVHIARDGSILLGNQGNHRLAMAKIVGVERIPCYVRARHLDWQLVRDRISRHGPEKCWAVVDPKFATHPDLADLLGSDLGTSGVEDDLYGIAEKIPSMGGAKISSLLRKLARNAPGDTSVVEVGCWLGAVTAQLALGIRERHDAGDVWLHCYDRWQASETEIRKAERRDVHLSVGEDTLPHVRRTLEPFNIPIRFHKGDIWDLRWNGGPISVYVDDASKTPGLFYHALQTFGPSWVPGETVMVFMDYEFWKKTGEAEHKFQQHFIESNSICFEPIESNRYAVFLYKDAINFSRLSAESEIWSLSVQVRERDEEIRHLKKSTSWRVTAPLRSCSRVVRGLLRSGERRSSSG